MFPLERSSGSASWFAELPIPKSTTLRASLPPSPASCCITTDQLSRGCHRAIPPFCAEVPEVDQRVISCASSPSASAVRLNVAAHGSSSCQQPRLIHRAVPLALEQHRKLHASPGNSFNCMTRRLSLCNSLPEWLVRQPRRLAEGASCRPPSGLTPTSLLLADRGLIPRFAVGNRRCSHFASVF